MTIEGEDPVVLSRSGDGGRSWCAAYATGLPNDKASEWGDELVLEDEDPPVDESKVTLDRAHRANEFSYPAIVAVGTKLVVIYTWKRERICYREIEGA